MKITCVQFEGLIPFYLNNELSDKLRKNFEQHMRTCPVCAMRFNLLKEVISDLKQRCSSFEKYTVADEVKTVQKKLSNKKDEILSAYIDNELGYELALKMRRAIISTPALKNKAENMYKLKKIMNESFNLCRDKLKTDYSKKIIRRLSGKKTFICYSPAFILATVLVILCVTAILLLNVI